MPSRAVLKENFVTSRGIGENKNTSTVLKSDGLFQYVKPLASLSAVMLYLAEAGNERLTINQAAFFLIAAAADARGVPLTVTEIMEGADGVINKSVANTYKVLLGHYRDAKNDGLGWLEREVDPDDERRKYLRLTPKGKAVVKAAALIAGTPMEDPS